MAAPSIQLAVDPWAMSEAESIALAYLRAADDDRWAALVRLAQDALSDLNHAESAIRERGHLISHGYIRAGLGH